MTVRIRDAIAFECDGRVVTGEVVAFCIRDGSVGYRVRGAGAWCEYVVDARAAVVAARAA